MAEALEGPEISGEACCLFDLVYLLIDVHPFSAVATRKDVRAVLRFIENYRLVGKGLGYVDMHLLASVLLTRVTFWTLVKKLNKVAVELRPAPE